MNIPEATETLNDGQKAALDLDRDLLVMAGAGAGKTEVLGLRILALLEHGRARIQDIVAFTFTNKAAAEMRERVQFKLMQRIAELTEVGEVTRRDLLVQARRDFDQNHISTMHSFCQRLLNEYAWEVGLEPSAPLLDERQQKQTRDAAARRVMLHTDAETEPEIAAALKQLGRVVKPVSLSDALKRIISNRDDMIPAIAAAAAVWRDADSEIKRRQEKHWQMIVDAFDEIVAVIETINWGEVAAAKDGDKLKEAAINVRDVFQKPETIVVLLDGDNPILTKGKSARSFGKAGAKTRWSNEKALIDCRLKMTEISTLTSDLLKPFLHLMFDPDHEQHVGESLISLNTLSARLLEIYTEERAGRLDFAELEIAAIKLLTEDKKIREEVQSRIKFLLIDEFQDTNPTQERLFRCLMSKNDPRGRFFAVGDAKQAIYGFRRSDVRIFKSFEKKVQDDNQSLANQPQELAWGMNFNDAQSADVKTERQSGLIKLVKNYRTVSETLNAGNRMFNGLFTVDKPEDYDPEPQDMEVGRDADSPEKPVEIHILEKERVKKGEESIGDRANNRDAEATFIASRILDLTNNHGVDFKDITILVRRATRNHVYRKVFARAGIPLLVRGEAGLFKTQEALDCINLLRVLARPADDIALMGLLRSSFVGVTDTWLTRMGMATDRKTGLYSRVVAQQTEAPDEHIASFIELYENLRQRAGRDTPATLLQEAIAQTGYLLAVQNGPASEQRKANVQRIIDLVRELQALLPSLAILVRDLETRAAKEDPETQGIPEGSFEGVELMTIHKSKGLAFNTVFIPDMGMVSGGGMFPPMICELPDEGGQLGLRLPRIDDARRGQQRPDLEGWLADNAADLRSTSEVKRVVYVAYTRAIERVIMVGSCGKSLKIGSWASQLLEPFGISDYGDEKPENLPFEFSWAEMPGRLPGHSGKVQIATLKAAYDGGVVNMRSEIDSTLVAPLVKAEPVFSSHNHEAAEFGTLLHAELEKRIRCNSKSIEFGIVSLNPDLTRQANNGIAALSTLPAAKELPEFGVVTPEGKRRIDLLRDVGDGQFQIVDYKSDAVTLTNVETKAEEHRQQLEGYRAALIALLESRGEPVNNVELFVCFTAPEELQPEERLVKLS